jgi:hypothetical protein
MYTVTICSSYVFDSWHIKGTLLFPEDFSLALGPLRSAIHWVPVFFFLELKQQEVVKLTTSN